MGEGEAVTPAEEAGIVATKTEATPVQGEDVDVRVGADETAMMVSQVAGAPPRDAGIDPWQALVQVGAQLISALAAANDPTAPAHPWIERDPTTGERNLKMPLPPPETASRIADTLLALADTLRGRVP
jgi:hypothetical protein